MYCTMQFVLLEHVDVVLRDSTCTCIRGMYNFIISVGLRGLQTAEFTTFRHNSTPNLIRL